MNDSTSDISKRAGTLTSIGAAFLLGSAVGLTGGLSFLRTSWQSYNVDLFFWASIVLTIFGVIFLVTSVWQYVRGEYQAAKAGAQVKVWMQDANGIREALQKIVGDNLAGRYSTTNDVCNAVWAVQSSANALYQSLYEERCVTEAEYKERQRKIAAKIDAEQLAAPLPTVGTGK